MTKTPQDEQRKLSNNRQKPKKLAIGLHPNIFNHPEWWPKKAARELQASYIIDADRLINMVGEIETATQTISWQPIETAPKDGTYILLWNGTWHLSRWGEISHIHHDNYSFIKELKSCWLNEFADGINFCSKEPTHWMELPNGP
jgi:hypothetical protein